MRITAARAYLAGSTAAVAVYLAIHGSYLLYQLFGLSAVLAIVAGIRRHRPANARAWAVFAGAQCALWAADITYFTIYGGSPPYPSGSDAVYLFADVVFMAALVLLISGRGHRDVVTYLDAAVVALAAGLLLWVVFFDDILIDGSVPARIVSIAYPIFDLALLGTLVRVLFARGVRTPSFFFVVGSVLLLVLSDSWYVIPALTARYVPGTWRDVGWLASYAFAGAAALHPSMSTFVRQRQGDLPLRRVTALGLALVAVALAAVLQQAIEHHVNVYAFASIGAAMATFITIRVTLLVRTLEKTRVEAIASERRFRMIFDRAPIGISIGRDGLLSETNPALQRMLGYTSEELSQLHYLEITHPDDREIAEQSELEARLRHAFSVDKRYVRKDGSAVDTHVLVARDVVDGLGISLIEDVGERRALEEQLRQSQKMEAIGKLAGGIAHDFNNLMTAVIGYSDLLLGDVENGPRRTRVEAIRDAAVRASDLTRQLLAFSRRQVLQVADVDLRDVVAEMDSLMHRLIGEDIRFETVFGAEPVTVRADRGQLEQVVMNLVVNARDAVRPGGSITVAVLSDGREAVLSVSDDGDGMDAATQARVFEPFFTTKPLGERSGLGLATVHGIVGQSGGSIEVESERGEGTVFVVRLPLAAARPASALPSPEPAATLVD